MNRNHPRKRTSGYALFVRQTFLSCTKEPRPSMVELFTSLDSSWRSLPEEVREQYKVQAKRLNQTRFMSNNQTCTSRAHDECSWESPKKKEAEVEIKIRIPERHFSCHCMGGVRSMELEDFIRCGDCRNYHQKPCIHIAEEEDTPLWWTLGNVDMCKTCFAVRAEKWRQLRPTRVQSRGDFMIRRR